MMILVILVISPLSISLQVSYKLIINNQIRNKRSFWMFTIWSFFFFYCLTKINVNCINKNTIKVEVDINSVQMKKKNNSGLL